LKIIAQNQFSRGVVHNSSTKAIICCHLGVDVYEFYTFLITIIIILFLFYIYFYICINIRKCIYIYNTLKIHWISYKKLTIKDNIFYEFSFFFFQFPRFLEDKRQTLHDVWDEHGLWLWLGSQTWVNMAHLKKLSWVNLNNIIIILFFLKKKTLPSQYEETP
jgi:hypothetical protein